MPAGNEALEKSTEQVLGFDLDEDTKARLLARLKELGPELGDSNNGNSEWQRDAAASLRRYRGQKASDRVDTYTQFEGGIDNGSDGEKQTREVPDNSSPFVEQFSAGLVDKCFAIIIKGMWDGGNLIECIPTKNGDDEQARQASLALESIMFGTKASRENIEDILKDGFLSPFATGEVRLYQPPPIIEFYRNKSVIAYEEVANDPELTILMWSREEAGQDPNYPDGFKYNLRVERKRDLELRIESVPVEEMIVPTAAKTIDQSRPDGPVYVARRSYLHLAQVLRLHTEKRKEILAKASDMKLINYSDGEDNQASPTFQERHDGNTDSGNGQGGYEARGAITLYDEYLWFDLGGRGDDYRLLNVVRMQDDTILHVSEVENNPFSTWSCYRVPGALIGVSMEHRIGEYNELLTAIRRFFIYNMAYLLFPGWLYSKSALGEDAIAKMNEIQPGATIEVRSGSVADAMVAIPRAGSESVAGASQSIANELSAYATSQVGMDEAMAGAENAGPGRSASGLAIAQSKGMVIFEQVARQFAHCLTGLARQTLCIMIDNADKPFLVRTQGGFVEVNPANFDRRMEINFNLTAAIAIRSQKLQDLTMILGVFEKLSSMPEKSLLFGVKNIHSLLTELFSVLGYQYPERFLKDLPENVEELAAQLQAEAAKDPKIDAKMKEVEMKLQAEMEKTQGDQGLKREELGLKQAALSQEGQLRLKEIMIDWTLSMHKIATETKNKNLQIQVEAMIKLYEIGADERIAKIQAAVKMAADKAKRVATGTRPGGDSV